METIQQKWDNKRSLQQALALAEKENALMIGMVTRLTSQKGLDLLLEIADHLLTMDVQLVIIGTGDHHYETALRHLERNHHDKVRSLVMFSSEWASKIYAASDVFLMPSKSEPCGLSQLIAMRYGSIPIVHRVGGLKDTVIPFDGKVGTGFTFESFNAYDMLDAIRRANHLYTHEKKAWLHLMKQAMQKDVSWAQSAQQYIDMYQAILEK